VSSHLFVQFSARRVCTHPDTDIEFPESLMTSRPELFALFFLLDFPLLVAFWILSQQWIPAILYIFSYTLSLSRI